MTDDPRILIRANAAEGAALQRQANAPRPPAVRSHLRTGRRTAQAIAALVNLRADIALGLPASALIDRIDDELFKLKR